MEAGFLPALDKDQADRFTPSELCLYQHWHAQDHRLLTLNMILDYYGPAYLMIPLVNP